MIVKYIPNTPFSFSYGGFEIQTQAVLEAVQLSGVDAMFIDFYNKDDNFDIIHLWGASVASSKLAVLAQKANKKVVVTALLSYLETFKEKFDNKISDIIRKNEYLKILGKYADFFVVLNEVQRQIAVEYYNIKPEKVTIIPNAVHNVFFEPNVYIKDNYVLCSGNICRRKNQLNLSKACIELERSLVLLGSVLDGEQEYASQLENLISKSNKIQWIRGATHASEAMLDIYKNASLMALPSFIEQQPISLLEAAAMQIPILTSEKAYGKQKYYENAKLVNPESVKSIADGISKVFNSPRNYIVPKNTIASCNTLQIGNAYKKLYESLA